MHHGERVHAAQQLDVLEWRSLSLVCRGPVYEEGIMGERVHAAHRRRGPGGVVPVIGLPRPTARGYSRRRDQLKDGGARQRAQRTVVGGDGVVHPRARGVPAQGVPRRPEC